MVAANVGGQIDFGHLNAAARPPKAPSPSR